MAEHQIINPYERLQIVHNSDDTLTRLNHLPTTAATDDTADQKSHTLVLSKDIPLNIVNKTWVRIFRPPSHTSSVKLPLMVYFHGGGFILRSAASTIYHDFCSNMAIQLPALIVSVEHRLAPESRLPAAYEDAIEALHWVRKHASQSVVNGEDDWLSRDSVDFSRCYLMGSSSGANIAFHARLRALTMFSDAADEPLKIIGLIMHHPFFGGFQRTESEMRLFNNPRFSMSVSDLMWDLALPVGSDRDHGYCNPLKVGESCHGIGLLGRCLVTTCGGDPLIDRQTEFVKMLEGEGVNVLAQFDEEGYHLVELYEPDKAQALLVIIKDFIFQLQAQSEESS
ncbi:PREDICTED: carboxylesterase 1-like [Nelumbo nucifera]|uniref:Alpha/beta hydrolase fold-3 domain-containing protein n=2 Tax=Nelumbo nucifera TaxID=4432 RepID=A0A822ZM33_NELNU|nr:PREDICTED: carboxylesterase 1-like [Nelumbo nucifera]DAD45957.1 TPA_asm: hypothetical protein HUJ06_004187 [Nelumbo nucifera]